MKTLRRFLVFVLFPVVALISTVQAASEPSDPASVVKAMYKLDIKLASSNGDYIKAERPYLAPDLYARIEKILSKPTEPGDAGSIDEDLILGAQDTPTKYTVGQATIDHDTATVPVDLAWDSDKLHYIVHLKQFSGAWKVTEIDYGKNGKLTDLLK